MKIETNSAQENHLNIKFKSLRELQDKHLLAPVFVGMYVKDGGSFSHRSAVASRLKRYTQTHWCKIKQDLPRCPGHREGVLESRFIDVSPFPRPTLRV